MMRKYLNDDDNNINNLLVGAFPSVLVRLTDAC